MIKIQTESFSLATISAGDENAEKFALVIPGRLDTKDYAHMQAHVEHLASLGYFAVSFDPPGTWESVWDMDLYSVTNYQKAIDEVIEYYGNRPTLIVGHSRGGAMAILAAARNEHITRLITVMSRATGQDDIPEWRERGYIDEYRDIPPGRVRTPKDDKIYIKFPYSFHADSMQYNVFETLTTLTKPKLMFSGKQDTTTPPKVIEAAYEQAAEPKQYYQVDFEHDYRLDQNIIDEVNQRIGGFLEVYPEVEGP